MALHPTNLELAAARDYRTDNSKQCLLPSRYPLVSLPYDQTAHCIKLINTSPPQQAHSQQSKVHQINELDSIQSFVYQKREHCLFGERFFLFYSYLEILRRCCVQPRIVLGNTRHVCEQMSVAQSAAPDKCEDLTGRINHKTCNMKSCTI